MWYNRNLMSDFERFSGPSAPEPSFAIENSQLVIRLPIEGLVRVLRDATPNDPRDLTFAFNDALNLSTAIETCGNTLVTPDIVFENGICVFNEGKKELKAGFEPINMSTQEFSIMRALARAREFGHIVEMEALLDEVYNSDTSYPELTQKVRTIQNRISDLRTKARLAHPALQGRNRVISAVKSEVETSKYNRAYMLAE